jgi:phosphonate transport system substrate-binding protein
MQFARASKGPLQSARASATTRPGFWSLAFGLVVAVLVGLAYVFAPRDAPVSAASDGLVASAAVPERPVRVAMSAAFVSEHWVPLYGELTAYLGEKAGTRHELITGLAYSTISHMLESGAIDFGFVCGYPYILAHDKPVPDMELLAGAVMKHPRYLDKPVYFSDLIVSKDSAFRSLRDLEGRTLVYNEETSNSGYNMPRSHLVELGLTHGFFGRVLRSGSHEESIRMVAEGSADASYVDSLVLDFDREKRQRHAEQVRVIESLGPAPIVPLVASAKVAKAERDRIQRDLLTMHQDEQGRRILDRLLIDRFVVVTDDHYDSLREMKKRAEDAGFLVIK